MRRGREVTSLPAGGLTSGSRGAGWICHQPLEQGERPCSFPLRKTDVLPPPARRIPLWITSSRAPPEGHLCWVLKPFHGWNSTNHPCSPLELWMELRGELDTLQNKPIPVVQPGCSSCGGTGGMLNAASWGWIEHCQLLFGGELELPRYSHRSVHGTACGKCFLRCRAESLVGNSLRVNSSTSLECSLGKSCSRNI